MKKTFIRIVFVVMVCLLVMVSVTYAWFYFPTNQNMDIETPSDLPVNVKVYHLENNKLVLKQDIDTDSPDTINLNCDMSFFQWGLKFYIEDAETQYYAIECTYESDAFKEGKLKLVMDGNLLMSSDVRDVDDDGNPLYSKFTFAEISYAFCKDANIDLSATTTLKTIMESEYTTFADFSDIKINDNDETTTINQVVEQNLRQFDKDGNAFNKNLSAADEEPQYILRFIIFIKIEPDTENIDDAFENINFGDAIYVYAINEYSFDISFKTDPTKFE